MGKEGKIGKYWIKFKEAFKKMQFLKFLLGLVLLVMIFAIACCIIGFFHPVFKYDNANLVITFLGILATFVVVSNFSQVSEIRNNTEKDLEKMRKKMDENQKDTEKKLSDMRKDLDAANDQLEQINKISAKITSNLLVDINKIWLAISKEQSEEKKAELLDELTVYADTNDPEIRAKIVEVLNGVLNEAAGSERIAQTVFFVADTISPCGDKENDSLESLSLMGYELIYMALCINKPKNGLYGFEIMKKVLKITKNTKEAKEDLEQLKTKFSEEIKRKYLDALIKDLNPIVMGLPVFDDAELQKYVYGD